jgi:hypothetical protein
MLSKLVVPALTLTAAVPASASAETTTVRCGNDENISRIVGKNIAPMRSRFGGKQGGCWVVDWVASTGFSWWERHAVDGGARTLRAHLRVAPRDATQSEVWSYTFAGQRYVDDWLVTARCGRHVVTSTINP